MFEIGYNRFDQPANRRQAQSAHAVHAAQSLYRRERTRAILAHAFRFITGRRRTLYDLRSIEASCVIRGRHAGGTVSAPLRAIRGSENRTADFDSAFRPREEHTRQRWERIAIAQYMDVPLPSISLVKVGDVYFVQDGHHRVSVARAMGLAFIDATVTIWDVVGPLPWERPVVAPRPAGQPA